jgi:hypothetical protein
MANGNMGIKLVIRLKINFTEDNNLKLNKEAAFNIGLPTFSKCFLVEKNLQKVGNPSDNIKCTLMLLIATPHFIWNLIYLQSILFDVATIPAPDSTRRCKGIGPLHFIG